MVVLSGQKVSMLGTNLTFATRRDQTHAVNKRKATQIGRSRHDTENLSIMILIISRECPQGQIWLGEKVESRGHLVKSDDIASHAST